MTLKSKCIFLLFPIILLFSFSEYDGNLSLGSNLIKNSIKVKSLSIEDQDFSDLQRLKETIGDARLVLLGEQTHGEGTTFRAKARLVRFLHEEMGFDVLTFESNHYGLRNSWEKVINYPDSIQFLRKGLIGMYSYAKEIQPLLTYSLQSIKTPNPLIIAGMDCDYASGNLVKIMLNDMQNFLLDKKIDLPTANKWKNLKSIFSKVADFSYYIDVPSKDELTMFYATVDDLIEEIDKIDILLIDEEVKFWKHHLKNQKRYVQYFGMNETKSMLFNQNLVSIRDSLMASNLNYLSETKYKDKKIIVWAATSHIMKKTYLVKNLLLKVLISKNYKTMGDFYAAFGKRKTYSIVFTAGSGKYQSVFESKSHILSNPKKKSLEYYCQQAGIKNAIIDLKQLPKEEKFSMRPSHNTYMKAPWPKMVDCVFYTDTVGPCELVDIRSNEPKNSN